MRIWFVNKSRFSVFSICTDRQRKMCAEDGRMCASFLHNSLPLTSTMEDITSEDKKKARWFFRACGCYDLKRVSA